MTIGLHQWAVKYGVSPIALFELQCLLGEAVPDLPEYRAKHDQKTEAFVQSVTKLRSSQEGVRVTRNNVGALIPQGGTQPVRFGLFNESAGVNALVKSSDLVGWRPVLITRAHVGTRLAQFWARECKRPSWVPGQDPREEAQRAFVRMVNAAGGDAAITNGSEIC